ncbi:MAG: 5-formyltetrahydrofolate cyclo-ligase [Alphaproteobacteria bacterium]|nr:5-formyltetrahydrofolate cyclo-ligase [Alphaproteobacteria bacterium]
MTQTTKETARKTAYTARKIAHRQGHDPAACAHLAQFLASLARFQTVAAYMPIRTEISPLPVMNDLAAAGKSVCVPVIQAPRQPLKFSRWTPGTKMLNGPFGAAIPEIADTLIPDILITPLVGFDTRGYRLGYGGGFYDRTFALLRKSAPAMAVGFAYSGQELPLVPTEPTDIRLDVLVTENGVIRF